MRLGGVVQLSNCAGEANQLPSRSEVTTNDLLPATIQTGAFGCFPIGVAVNAVSDASRVLTASAGPMDPCVSAAGNVAILRRGDCPTAQPKTALEVADVELSAAGVVVDTIGVAPRSSAVAALTSAGTGEVAALAVAVAIAATARTAAAVTTNR